MSSSLREVLQTKTKEELIEMYVELVETPKDIYYELAITDPLTQVYNRRGAEAKFEELQKTDNIANKKLVFIDLDHFKHINDDLGHDWGDRALFVTATYLKKYFENDIIIRFGGDEFLVITDKQSDYIDKFNEQAIWTTYNKDTLLVRCSCGHAPYKNKMSLHDWIVEADKLMYKNKQKKIK